MCAVVIGVHLQGYMFSNLFLGTLYGRADVSYGPSGVVAIDWQRKG